MVRARPLRPGGGRRRRRRDAGAQAGDRARPARLSRPAWPSARHATAEGPGRSAGGRGLAAVLSGFFARSCPPPVARDPRRARTSYTADAHSSTSASVKSFLDHGWYWHNPNLGAPEGQQLFDYPGAERRHAERAAAEAARRLRARPRRLAVDLFFLLTFFQLVGFSRLPRAAAAVGLVAESRALSVGLASKRSCHSLPLLPRRGRLLLACGRTTRCHWGRDLVLMVLGGRAPLFARRAGGRRLALVRLAHVARDARPLAGGNALASGSFYYSAFTIILVAVCRDPPRSVVTRSRRPLAQGGAVVGAILAISLATMVAFHSSTGSKHGRNRRRWRTVCRSSRSLRPQARAARAADQTEHRIERLAGLRQGLQHLVFDEQRRHAARRSGWLRRPVCSGLLAVSLLQLASPGRPVASRLYGQARSRNFLWRSSSGGPWGLTSLIAPGLAADPVLEPIVDLHRLLCAALWWGSLLDRAFAGLRSRARRWRAGERGCSSSCSLLALLDQTSSAYKPDYAALEAEYRSERVVRARRSRSGCPASAMVFQLPYHSVPGDSWAGSGWSTTT